MGVGFGIGLMEIVILAVIVVGGVFAAAWFFMAGKDRDQD
jgi:hypothetical protein